MIYGDLMGKNWKEYRKTEIQKQRHRDSNKKYKLNHPEQIRRMRRNWEKNHPEQTRNYRLKHPEKCNARQQAERNVLLAEYCELCPEDDQNKATQHHHPDYNYSLIIVSVCDKCHKWMGW
jgi:hypothetical protein